MRSLTLACAACAVPALASATTISPISYTYNVVPNGVTAYLDDTYDGTLGQLADGIKATVDWQVTDGFGATGPNVGWSGQDPSITFMFDQVYKFTTVTVNAQDGQGAFGVSRPSALSVFDGTTTVSAPVTGGGTLQVPLDFSIDVSALAATNTLTVQVTRSDTWVFLSEVEFSTAVAPVPLPASGMLLFAALGGIGVARSAHRNKQAKRA